MAELITGDTQTAPDAGEQQPSAEQLLGLEPVDTGETEPADAGQGAEQEPEDAAGDEPEATDDVELAFKKRLERERAKLEERIRAEYEERLRQSAQPVSYQQAVEHIADQLGITIEAAQVILQQQLALNEVRESAAKAEAKAQVEALRAERPELPTWDEQRLQKIRADYQQRYGTVLPWMEAYRQLIAEDALSGRLRAAAEQQTLANIESRNKATVKTGKGQDAPIPSIWDLPKDQFEKLIERVKAGEFTQS